MPKLHEFNKIFILFFLFTYESIKFSPMTFANEK